MREWAETAEVAASTNRALFLKAKPDVESLLAEGWSVRKIWAFLQSEGRIAVGFSSFARDVRRLITEPVVARSSTSSAAPIAAAPAVSPSPSPDASSAPETPVEAPATEATEARPRPKRFSHPDSPKKEDYL